jgi:restriction system protein
MSAVEISFTYNGAINDVNLSLNFNFKQNYDLSHITFLNERSFFDLLKKNLKQWSLGYDYKYNFELPIVNYIEDPNLNRKSIKSNSISEFPIKIEMEILEMLLQWNRDFISNYGNLESKIWTKDPTKNEKLINLYNEEFSEDDYWFNRFSLLYNDSLLDNLYLIRDNIINLPIDLGDIEKLPNDTDLNLIDIDFWDSFWGNKQNKERENENRLKNHLDQIERIKYRNEQIEIINKKWEIQKELLKDSIKDKINISTNVINEFEDTIEKYEEGKHLEDFVKGIIKFSKLNSLYKISSNVQNLNSDNHIGIDIDLPLKEDVSNIKGYKEYKRERRFEPILYNDKDYQKVYNKVLYSVVFRVLNEVYLSDYNRIIKTVTFNGWVNIPNKKNGKFENRCILSVTISRDKFENLDYNHIDLKLAFDDLKGISAANLSEYTPIAPLVVFDKKDNRFIQSEEVLKNIDTSTNLASVDWEAFEHLVRELFEKEFAHNGGEVKVTQSSRDGGVDAIAFDPDPIRGGKIVIQSKRYTNVVGVSAIRDLYGTVMNEGATKGIIVTTSHYGNDAYEFAKGKPLTLLDGNNLLALLQKHGYKARINIEEAKELNKLIQ